MEYRSLVFVPGYKSATGDPYAKGDLIPLEEAVRQGQVEPDPDPVWEPVKACGRCRGSGTYSKKRPPGHRVDCGCKFCGTCPRCGGSGEEPDGPEEAT